MAALTRDALIARYHSFGKPSKEWRVGGEFERHLLWPNGQPLAYEGQPGVRGLLEAFAKDGWAPKFEGTNPVEVHHNMAAVTLEPGSQFELSGAPYTDVAGVAAEAKAFAEQLNGYLAGTGVRQVALGFTPYAAITDIPWVPKGRYKIMRDHLGQTGDLAHYMMKGTCATQASYDFADEADCARKVGLATQLGPLTTALFANSPLREGKDSGFMSFRGHIWTRTDPRRTGFPDAADNFKFEAWVDYLLDVPMMFRKRRGEWEAAHGRTFRAWMTDEVDAPTDSDWELHLTSVFPEVRTKQTIEVRGADCVPFPLAMSFVALFEGLFYDEAALDAGLELATRFSAAGTRTERFDEACLHGLAGQVGGKRLADWGSELVEIASAGLSRWRPGDVGFMAPLAAQCASGESRAAAVLRWHQAGGTAETLDKVGDWLGGA